MRKSNYDWGIHMRAATALLCGAALVLSLAAHAGPLIGVYRSDWAGGPANVNAFSAWLGREVDFAVSFAYPPTSTDWSHIDGHSAQLGPWSTWMKARPGRTLVHSFAMMPRGSGVTLAQIAAGQYDSHYKTLADRLVQYGMQSIYLRPGWEMDGGWYPWNAKAGSGKEASFAAAYRRIVQVMRARQPTATWKFVFAPTDYVGHVPVSAIASYLESIWPGNAYVDVVAPTIYDQCWNSIDGSSLYYPPGSNRLDRQKKVWAIRAARLSAMKSFATSHGKPMGTHEWGLMSWLDHKGNAGHGGGDNPYFIEKMYEFMVANNFVAAGYFDVKTGQPSDHRLGPLNPNHPLSGAKYKQLFGAIGSVQNVSTGPTGVMTVKNSSVSTTNAPPPGSTMSYDQLWNTIKSANPLLDDNSLRTIVDSKWNDMRMPAAAPAPAPAPAPSAPPPPQPSRSTMSYDQLWNTIKSANPLLDDDSLRTIVDSKWNDMQ
jgi:Glycosyl hydrolase family 26